MSHKDNADLRSTGDGGWFYAENELFSIFAPLIGPDGVATYMAMCRLIPLAAVDPDRQVTKRAVGEASCVSVSQVQRKMDEIVRLGMVVETRSSRNRPSTFKLISLKKLAEEVSLAELKLRLGVPPGYTRSNDDDTEAESRAADQEAPSRSGGVVVALSASAADPVGSTLPGASDGSGVPPWHTVAEDRELSEFEGSEASNQPATGDPVYQKEASVYQKEASVYQKRPSVYQNEGLLKEEEEEEEERTPLPPLPGGSGPPGLEGGAAELILPYAECGHRDPGFVLCVGIAARWVMARCAVTDARMERILTAQLAQRCQLNHEFVEQAAALAVRHYALYQSCLGDGLLRIQWGVPRFFSHGHWQFPHTWPYDEDKLQARRRAASASQGVYRGDPP